MRQTDKQTGGLFVNAVTTFNFLIAHHFLGKQESPAIADKPARRESMLKLLQFDDRRAYNVVAVVADNTGLSSFV